MKSPPLPLWRMPRSHDERLVDTGVFGPEDRIELLDGLRVVREPPGERHATVVGLVREPDVAVVPGKLRDYLTAHPARPVLVVEVADSSLALDRRRKGGLYARAGIADYWVVNLIDEALEVYREPLHRTPGRGWNYDSVRGLRRNAVVTPLAAPRARIRVAALLP